MKFALDDFRHIVVRPVTGTLGAEIEGIDAGEELDAAIADELRLALARFSVLFVRDQNLDQISFLRFAQHFGRIGRSPLGAAEGPVSVMARAADVPADVRNNGDRWHADRAHDERPPKGFLLYCEEAPEYGGDTLFASLAAAYDALPDELKTRCCGLTGLHSMSGVLDVDGTGRDRQSIDGRARPAEWVAPEHRDYVRQRREHPLVCAHPDTGRPLLFVSGAYLTGIKELPEAEAMTLVDELNRHAVRPEFTCRFRWRKGSLAVLDNRVTQHYAVNDYAGFARRMLRVELAGDWIPARWQPRLEDA